jgi:hypothetical protein
MADWRIFGKMPEAAEGIRAFTPVVVRYGWNPVFRPKMRHRKMLERFLFLVRVKTALVALRRFEW